MEDIVPALLQRLQRLFDANIANDGQLQALLETLAKGGAGYAQAEDAAWQIGDALARAFGQGLTAQALPDGRLYWNIADRALRPLLEQGYTMAVDAACAAQDALNAAGGIGIRVQRPKPNKDRIDGLLNAACAKENFEEAAALLDAPVRTLAQSAADDTLRANVAFQGKAGLRPTVIRKAESKCCKWCAALAGRYTYPDVPKDVFRRHANCRCVVEYDPGGGKKQNVWSKRWTDPEERAILEERKRVGLRDEWAEAEERRNDAKARETGITTASIQRIHRLPSTILTPQAQQQLVGEHKKLLLAANRYAPGTEVARCYTLDIKPLCDVVVGEPGRPRVKIPTFQQPYLVMHNHPDGGSFSPNDLRNFANNPNIRVATVVGNNGKVYALEKLDSFDEEKIKTATYNALLSMKEASTLQQAVEIMKSTLQEVQNYGAQYFIG